MNTALAYQNPEMVNNIVSFRLVQDKKETKYTKTGEAKKTHCNRVTGESSEVYAFRTKEEIDTMLEVLNRHIEEADIYKKQIAYRNRLLFLIGVNIGIRASDLRELRWSFFYDEDEEGNRKFKESYKIQPKKQRKAHKFVTMYFNNTVKKAIEDYLNKYPVDDIESCVFFSHKRNEPISTAMLWKIIKDTAQEAGIKQNIGAHSLRKTFGFWCWHEAKNKEEALTILQFIFNHSDARTTMKYIGLMESEIKDMYNSVNIGFDFM